MSESESSCAFLLLPEREEVETVLAGGAGGALDEELSEVDAAVMASASPILAAEAVKLC
jgi:hypothetical protein